MFEPLTLKMATPKHIRSLNYCYSLTVYAVNIITLNTAFLHFRVFWNYRQNVVIIERASTVELKLQG